jgi:site-specific DNA-cytosine methylase
MRQLGNAVPVRLGEVVAKSVAKVILPISQSCNA